MSKARDLSRIPSGLELTVFMGPGDGNDYKSGATFTNFVTFPYDVTIETIDYQYLQSTLDGTLEQFGYKVGAGSFVALDTYTGTAAGTRAATKDVSIAVSAGTRFYVSQNTSNNAQQSRIVVSIHYKVN